MATHKEWMAVIHVAKSKLGLSDDEYRDALERATRKRSASKLTEPECRLAMAEFERMGFKTTSRPKPEKVVAGSDADAPVTQRQMAKMLTLYEKLGMDEAERRRGFARRQCGKPWPQTRADAQKVIEGLRAMGKRRGLNIW
jgi:hypothetical protein